MLKTVPDMLSTQKSVHYLTFLLGIECLFEHPALFGLPVLDKKSFYIGGIIVKFSNA